MITFVASGAAARMNPPPRPRVDFNTRARTKILHDLGEVVLRQVLIGSDLGRTYRTEEVLAPRHVGQGTNCVFCGVCCQHHARLERLWAQRQPFGDINLRFISISGGFVAVIRSAELLSSAGIGRTSVAGKLAFAGFAGENRRLHEADSRLAIVSVCRRRRSRAGFLVPMPVVWALVAGGLRRRRRQDMAPRGPIIVIAIDTLRADHLGLYGYERDTSPRLDALAAEGTVFEHAFATASWTLPSMTSLLTGTWPREHGAGYARTRGGDGRRFSRLARRGADSRRVVERRRVRNRGGGQRRLHESALRLRPRLSTRMTGCPAPTRRVAGRATVLTGPLPGSMLTTTVPFFFMLHLFDPHRHFDAPPPFRGKFTEVVPGSLRRHAGHARESSRG